MTQTTFTAKEAKNNFGRLLDEARISPVSINKNGKRVAVLMSIEDYEEERASPELLKELELSKKSGKVSSKQLKKMMGI
jgi:prevent-host-death family protein